MLRITTLDEAKNVWNEFEEKYNLENPHLPISPEDKKRNEHYTQRLSPEEVEGFSKKFADDKYTKHAAIIQRLWHRKRSSWKNSVIDVNGRGNHSLGFTHLLGQYAAVKKKDEKKTVGAVKKTLHKKKLDALKSAIDTGNWSADLLQPTSLHPDLHQKLFQEGSKEHQLSMLALSLYSSGQIDRHQAYTLLEYSQTVKNYGLKKISRILDDEGNFTPEAKSELIPTLQHRNFLKELSSAELNEFKLLVQALPKSEQVFYTTKINYYSPKGHLENFIEHLIGLDAIYSINDEALLHLTSGVRDALELAQFGIDGCVRLMPTLGEKSIEDIEHGVLHEARYAALNYPNTKPYGTIHHWEHMDDTLAILHDHYHSIVMSTQPTKKENGQKKGIRPALLKINACIRRATKIKNCKETWHKTDSNLTYFLHGHRIFDTQALNDKKMAEFLSDALLYSDPTEKKGSHLLTGIYLDSRDSVADIRHLRSSQFDLTAIGALVLIDMVENQQEWLDIGIDATGLTGKFKIYYEDVKNIYDDHLKGKDPKIQILKLQSFINLKKTHDLGPFNELSKLIDQNIDFMMQKVTFKKLTKSKGKPVFRKISNSSPTQYRTLNTIVLSYEDFWVPDSPSHFMFEDRFRDFQKKLLKDIYHELFPTKPPSDGVAFAENFFDLNQKQAETYIAECKKGTSPEMVGFAIKPTIARLYRLNPTLTILASLSFIGIFLILIPYAMYKQNQYKALLGPQAPSEIADGSLTKFGIYQKSSLNQHNLNSTTEEPVLGLTI